MKLTELISQPYKDAKFSAGTTDDDVDTVYLQLERGGDEPTQILLRPDEAAAILYCLSGTLWAVITEPLLEEDDESHS
jgi:hypothetical protein